MADILIRGMEKMPGNCRECMFAGFGGMRNELNVCMFSGESQLLLSNERMSKCPIVPLPEGYGDLMDKATCDPYFADRYPAYRLWAKARWDTGWASGTFYYYEYGG